MDGKKSVKVNDLSKLTKIEDLRIILQDYFDATSDQQKLFYRGKQLVDGHTLFDYKVGLNDIIQIIVKNKSLDNKENIPTIKNEVIISKSLEKKECEYCDTEEIKCRNCKCFKCKDGTSQKELVFCFICRKNYHLGCLNTNLKNELKSNKWQCPTCKSSEKTREKFKRFAKDYISDSESSSKSNREEYIPDISQSKSDIQTTSEIDKTKESSSVESIKEPELVNIKEQEEIKEAEHEVCKYCKDEVRMKCRKCQCCKCGDRRDQDRQILCDECNNAYHLDCLVPILKEIPDVDEWYCPNCKNDENEIVKPGEKLKKSKSKKPSSKSNKTRDWGRGMACAGRTSSNNMVPSNHRGPVPGVEVGMSWKFRVQVSESGCHRPPVAGIHGRESEGAYSLVLSGGYEDDLDEGDQFTYTGSGGRDLSGNKRTAAQSSDQKLTRMNMALAKSCAAPLNKEGTEAADWCKGQPIRVIRNVKGRKHSNFAPEEGNRYDGIYKIVKYWKSVGKSGFSVWKFLLRRDDEIPAPWTEEGQKRIEKLGFAMKYPEGYEEKKENSKENKEIIDDDNKSSTKSKKRKQSDDNSAKEKDSMFGNMTKKIKYDLEEDIISIIVKDKQNEKVWDEIKKSKLENYKNFLSEVEKQFSCICCQDIVLNPLIIECNHTICKDCLKRSFASNVYTCPTCRQEIGKHYKFQVNSDLSLILNKLFPNYQVGR